MLFCLQCSSLSLYCRLVYQVSHLHDWLMSVCVHTRVCVCASNIELSCYREVFEGVEQQAQGHLGFVEQ